MFRASISDFTSMFVADYCNNNEQVLRKKVFKTKVGDCSISKINNE